MERTALNGYGSGLAHTYARVRTGVSARMAITHIKGRTALKGCRSALAHTCAPCQDWRFRALNRHGQHAHHGAYRSLRMWGRLRLRERPCQGCRFWSSSANVQSL